MKRTGASVGNKARHSAASWRSPFGIIATTPYLFVAIVGLLAPDDVLTRYEYLDAVAKSGRAMLLAISAHLDISRFSASTAYPQAALLVSSLYWQLLPIVAALQIGLIEMGIRTHQWKYWRLDRPDARVNLREFAVILTGLGIFFLAAIVATVAPGDWSLLPGLTTNSRLGMVALQGIVFYCIPVLVGALFALIRAFHHFNMLGRK